MIVFHVVFDLDFFGYLDVGVGGGFWWFFARATAAVFIFLAGVSLALSYSRVGGRMGSKALRLKYLRRGLGIFSLGLLISLVTWFFLREGFIFFGILHFIGVSVILAYPLRGYRFRILLLGFSFMVVGVYLSGLCFGFPWLAWLGFVPCGLYTVDFFPLLPWFGVFLFGLFSGNLLYPGYVRVFRLPDLSGFFLVGFFCFLGRRSLFFYFIHQPVLVGFLYLLGVDVGFC